MRRFILRSFISTKLQLLQSVLIPQHRWPAYKLNTYRYMLPFPPEFAYSFLEKHADDGLSCRSIRALAVKEFGREPYEADQPKKRAVSIRSELFARLRPFSPSRKVAPFIEHLLEDWLNAQKSAEPPAATSRPSSVPEPDYTQPCPQKSAEKEAPRPTYAERREEQRRFAEPDPKKKCTCGIKPCFGSCPGSVKKIDGLVTGPRASRFSDCKKAEEANEQYVRCHGYREHPEYCEKCASWHLRHVFAADGLKEMKNKRPIQAPCR